MARRAFEMHLKALTAAIASLPEVLFVTSAGNSGNDPTFNDAYPSGIVLPNLVSVGAVDKAGDEAIRMFGEFFTSAICGAPPANASRQVPVSACTCRRR